MNELDKRPSAGPLHAGFRLLAAGLAGMLLLATATPSLAYRMVLLSLEEMAGQAERIVAGVCTAREEREAAVGAAGKTLRYTEYTFQVTDALKGVVGQTLTIRQVRLGGGPVSNRAAPPGAGQPLGVNPVPLPEYQVGQEVLLFLGGDSSLGFTSPVGMDQAVFDVETDALGRKMLKHRLGNQGLFRKGDAERLALTKRLVPEEAALLPLKEREPIPYAPFVSLTRKLINGN